MTPSGRFVSFPKIALYALEHLFRHRVLRLLLQERRIDESVIRTLLGWRHPETLRYQASTGTIIYQSKMHLVLKRNVEVAPASCVRGTARPTSVCP